MADMAKLNQDDDLLAAKLPSGGLFYVHQSEFVYFNERRDRYLADNHFQNISDFQDLDRLLISETLVWRWGSWLSQKRDYWGEPIDEQSWQRALKEHSAEIRQLKKSLGLDKETRDKQKGEGSVTAYIENLRQRAAEFGIMRNEQASKSIELFQQLKALITLHDNCDEKERLEQKISIQDILDWLKTTAIPEFDEIDAQFRETSQKYWIRDQ